MEPKWSKKLNKWVAITEIHPKHPNLTKFGDRYWYDFKKDKLIHIDIVDSYIEMTIKKQKQIKSAHYLSKNMIQKVEEQISNRGMMERALQKLRDNKTIKN